MVSNLEGNNSHDFWSTADGFGGGLAAAMGTKHGDGEDWLTFSNGDGVPLRQDGDSTVSEDGPA